MVNLSHPNERLPEKDYQTKQASYGQQMQVKKEVKTEQKTKVKTELDIDIVVDNAEFAGEAGTPTLWSGMDIFQNDFWKKDINTSGLDSINTYLKRNSNKLENADVTKDIFSENFKQSGNFASSGEIGGYPTGSGHRVIPFQTGSKPVGISALKIDDNNIELFLLSPSEIELLWKILEYDKAFDPKHFEDKDAKQLREKIGNITYDVVKDHYKTDNFDSYIQNKMRVFFSERAQQILENLFDDEIDDDFNEDLTVGDFIDNLFENVSFEKSWLNELKEKINSISTRINRDLILTALKELTNLHEFLSQRSKIDYKNKAYELGGDLVDFLSEFIDQKVIKEKIAEKLQEEGLDISWKPGMDLSKARPCSLALGKLSVI